MIREFFLLFVNITQMRNSKSCCIKFKAECEKSIGKPSMISGPALTIHDWIVHSNAFIPSITPQPISYSLENDDSILHFRIHPDMFYTASRASLICSTIACLDCAVLA
jgi:hypothetical protein